MGKLIVIEGLDGCGKSTQLEMLGEKLPDARFISFPRYDTNSGRLIKQYLNGEFRENDKTAGAYSASIMYAADRYAAYKTEWENDYLSGKLIVSARYVSSNAIYQMAKLDRSEWDAYLSWLSDLEYKKMKLPEPSKTIFLDMPNEISQKLLSQRYSGDETKKDIHERDTAFLSVCREAAVFAGDRCGWETVACSENGLPLPPGAVNERLVQIIEKICRG